MYLCYLPGFAEEMIFNELRGNVQESLKHNGNPKPTYGPDESQDIEQILRDILSINHSGESEERHMHAMPEKIQQTNKYVPIPTSTANYPNDGIRGGDWFRSAHAAQNNQNGQIKHPFSHSYMTSNFSQKPRHANPQHAFSQNRTREFPQPPQQHYHSHANEMYLRGDESPNSHISMSSNSNGPVAVERHNDVHSARPPIAHNASATSLSQTIVSAPASTSCNSSDYGSAQSNFETNSYNNASNNSSPSYQPSGRQPHCPSMARETSTHSYDHELANIQQYAPSLPQVDRPPLPASSTYYCLQ